MKAFVTGATGFVGRHLLQALRGSGHEVTALVRPTSDRAFLSGLGCKAALGDVTDPASLAPAIRGHDVVIHLAAAVAGPTLDWEWHKRVGVDGTNNVVEATVEAGVARLIHMSSAVVYARPRPGETLSEDSPLEEGPQASHYVRQKVLAERSVWRADSDGRLRVTCLRPPLVIGPGDNSQLTVVGARLASLAGKIADDQEQHIAIVVVEDLARAIVATATKEVALGKAYNLASAQPVTKGELGLAYFDAGMAPLRRSLMSEAAAAMLVGATRIADLPLSLLGNARPTRGLALKLLERRGRRPQADSIVDSTRAERELGWRGLADYRDAARKAVEWSRVRARAGSG